MKRSVVSRLTLAGAAVILAAFAVGSPAGSLVSPDALAQADSVNPVSAIQTPPPVPGIDYSSIETIIAPSSDGLLIHSTPVPPAMPGEASDDAAPEPAGGVTANLGGSDIAVSSVGGSYQVDAPGRRGNKKSRP